MSGPEQQKKALLEFWSKFGDRRNQGVGFSPEQKLAALIEMSKLKISYHTQQPAHVRREKFDDAKQKLHPWRRFPVCFICGNQAQHRHHIIQLKNGGINSKKNLISACVLCHIKIHPWMEEA